MSKKEFTDTTEKLAKAFSIILDAWLGVNMPELVEKNKTVKRGICASHDFCDSNMAMDAAFRIVIGRSIPFAPDEDPDGSIEAQISMDMIMVNVAWNKAKRHGFYYTGG